jgi:hypothetical protein
MAPQQYGAQQPQGAMYSTQGGAAHAGTGNTAYPQYGSMTASYGTAQPGAPGQYNVQQQAQQPPAGAGSR